MGKWGLQKSQRFSKKKLEEECGGFNGVSKAAQPSKETPHSRILNKRACTYFWILNSSPLMSPLRVTMEFMGGLWSFGLSLAFSKKA